MGDALSGESEHEDSRNASATDGEDGDFTPDRYYFTDLPSLCILTRNSEHIQRIYAITSICVYIFSTSAIPIAVKLMFCSRTLSLCRAGWTSAFQEWSMMLVSLMKAPQRNREWCIVSCMCVHMHYNFVYT